MKHIVLTIDRNFARYCAVTMVSALRNDAPQDLTFHIIANDLAAEDRLALEALAHGYGAGICFYAVPGELLEGYSVRWCKKRLSMVVFYRCCLPSVLPAEIDKVLYIDCDMLVLRPLDELWNTPLDAAALAAAPDSAEQNPKHPERLGYDAKYNYFNGGMLLINLKYWREHNVEQRCKDFYQKYPDRILMNDQDLLNGLLYDKKVLVDISYNLQEGAYRLPKGKKRDCVPNDISTLRSPGILHYSGRTPWQYHCMHPLRHLFFEYQEFTPWREEYLQRWTTKLHRFVHMLPYTLGLKSEKYIRL